MSSIITQKPVLFSNDNYNVLYEIKLDVFDQTVKQKFIQTSLPFKMDDSSGIIDLDEYKNWVNYYINLFQLNYKSDLYNTFVNLTKTEELTYIWFEYQMDNKPTIQALMCKVHNNKLYYAFENTVSTSFSVNYTPLLL